MRFDKDNYHYWMDGKFGKITDYFLWLIGKKERTGYQVCTFEDSEPSLLMFLLMPFKLIYLVMEAIIIFVGLFFVILGSIKFGKPLKEEK